MKLKTSILGLLMLWQTKDVYAASTGMPWDGPLQTIIRSLTGEVVFFVSVFITAIFGIVVAHSESTGWMKWGLRIILGLGIATSGTSFASTFFGVSRGALF